MAETYFDGGVSAVQISELGSRRPSIRAFLEFSEKYYNVPFRAISNFGGIEFFFDYESFFKMIGVNGEVLATCMDGDEAAIRFVCRRILESMDAAQELVARGEAHLASRGIVINPTATRAFILAALDARERYQYFDVIPELYFLLGQVLFPGEPEVESNRRSRELKTWISYVARAHHHKHGFFPSYRKMAKIFCIAPSTISRLFENQADFEHCANRMLFSERDISENRFLRAIYPHL